MYDFITQWTSDLESIDSLSDVDLPNIDEKISFINVTADLSRRVHVLRSC